MEAIRNLMVQAAGLDADSRLYRLELPGLPAVVVDHWHGHDALSQGRHLTIDVLALDASLPLADWLGQPACLHVRLADGQPWPRHGVIADARCTGSDGGLARYRITLRDWTWWMDQARCSRVFQEQSVREIVDAVLQGHAPLAHWRWTDEVDAFLAASRPRSFCVQYRESDLAFVQRLLAEEGLGWCVQEAQDAAAGHGMLLFADSTVLPESQESRSGGGIRFHRADASEPSDGVQRLGQHRRLHSTRVQLHSSDYRSVRSLAGQLPLQGDSEAPREDYDAIGAHAFADATELQHHAHRVVEAMEAQALQWQGRGSVRSADAGQVWVLTGLPGERPAELMLVSVEHAGVNNLPVDLRQALTAAEAVSAERDTLAAQARAHGYSQAFTALARDRHWRPVLRDGTGARRNPRPLAPGYQTAIVVAGQGSASDEVHADALGRVRVRFHFQDGAEGADSAWLRVAQRYAGPGVGSQFLPRIGQEVLVGFLEGDIDRPLVLGALYNGRGEAGVAPTPAGASAEADTTPFAQARDGAGSAQANLGGGQAPAWHAAAGGEQAHRHPGALWGVQSREWQGQGWNRLLFDDSDQQLRTQLASSQQHSALSLGHLRHQADNHRGSLRGSGFELRSDAWGSVRGQRGLWLDAYAHRDLQPAGSAAQPAALLQQVATLVQQQADAARTHLTVQPASHLGVQSPQRSRLDSTRAPVPVLLASVRSTVPGADLQEATGAAAQRSGDAGDGRVPHTGDALMGLAAPEGVVMVAGQGLHWAQGETLVLGSGQHSDATVMGQARWHGRQAIGVLAAAKTGADTRTPTLTLASATQQLDILAQQDRVAVQARQSLHAASAQAAVELGAGRTLHISTAGGASVTLSAGNIVFNAPGRITVHAGRKSFLPGGGGRYPLPVFPQSVCKECLLLAAQRASALTPKGG
ncbi:MULTISPECIES: type VI secretion system Vgr family protein [Stenotrophomonas]|jgi:type VI secretion system VgrG family protein|uniref:type VI secretion system Vgr family protein n=1 Tax=Stenotrophomonas TaxID=40323 RepID=UPI00201CC8A3|nr:MULTISPECIES: type VI secretion system Vgr family protein [Stenotrophomonas]MDH1274796.1 type VI secretion system tip protein VgrG [Stenotrophomonas sp. GD03937]MDH1486266.1 type VI secretion system tip protein VgrG [Stenotrophomonas sp. GD03712]UQY96352.1 type VI secretion system tip protein VgrG [Stenotrophomonas maltophilia]HDS1101599.1 type VI secretion system tip protein VgrG [Stenotrophomonas maltophilia]HDS1108363.1 type VI secretion system tip protein VgrG [Stenotrophomonas maltophi